MKDSTILVLGAFGFAGAGAALYFATREKVPPAVRPNNPAPAPVPSPPPPAQSGGSSWLRDLTGGVKDAVAIATLLGTAFGSPPAAVNIQP